MSGQPSFYEGIVRGLAGDVRGRRQLFLFLVDQGGEMDRALGAGGGTRRQVVRNRLEAMVSEMADADSGPETHLDLGLLGYGSAGDGPSGTLWSGNSDTVVHGVREAAERRLSVGALPPGESRDAAAAVRRATEIVTNWSAENDDPIERPIVLHIATDGPGSADIGPELAALGDRAHIATAILTEATDDAVVFPRPGAVPEGVCRALYDGSSTMPPLMQDVGALLQGEVTPRLRRRARDLASRHGLPRGLGDLAVRFAGQLARGGMRIPTGHHWYTHFDVGFRARGLRIDSNTACALVRDAIGFDVFARLCN